MDGELHVYIEPRDEDPIARVRRFTGVQPERYVPLELQGERSRRWATRTLIYALVVLAFLNAQSIRSWASTLAPSWASVTIRDLAEVWEARMAAAGFDQPRAGLRSSFEGAKALTWRRLTDLRIQVVTPKPKALSGQAIPPR
jgi:hypothetical protein